MGQNDLAPLPTAGYGAILLIAGVAYFILVRALIACEGQPPELAAAVGKDRKGIASVGIYAVAVPVAAVAPLASFALFVLGAGIWFVPDRRMERALRR